MAVRWSVSVASVARRISRAFSLRVLGRLGAGGVGLVYEARDRESGELVAIKTLRDVTPDGLYRLKREFRMLQGSSIPTCASTTSYSSMTGAGSSRWSACTVSSSSRMSAPANDATSKAARGARSARVGLCALHDAGLIHRDVKPSNVMVMPSGRVVLLDFGFVEDTTPRGAQPNDRRHSDVHGTRASACNGDWPARPIGSASVSSSSRR